MRKVFSLSGGSAGDISDVPREPRDAGIMFIIGMPPACATNENWRKV